MAQLIINQRESNDTVILDLNGDIIFGEGNIILRNEIRRQISEGKKKIHLNLEKVFYIDSSGIGELISGLTAVSREDGGELKILNPTDRIQMLFEIAHLTKVFDIHYEKPEASIS
ncbi:STAS domain-containing protein [soil metagenome]